MTHTLAIVPLCIFLPCISRLTQAISLLEGAYAFSSQEEVFDDFYPSTNVTRINVSGKARYDWEIPLPNYKPIYFTHPRVIGQPWADSEDVLQYKDKFNMVDGDLDRRRNRPMDYVLELKTGRPLNPTGRTGVCGRGLLGRWGPNHHASLIVSRWFRDDNNQQVIMPSSGKPLLEFVAVKCHGKWGVPGGFVREKETFMERAQLAFLEEALNTSNMTESDYKSLAKHVSDLFDESSFSVFQGYQQDVRNTDNAWIEGRVNTLHDEKGQDTLAFVLKPGHKVQDVNWLIAHRDMLVNPIHKEFMKYVTKLRDAHW